MTNFTGSIVLFKNEKALLGKVIKSYLDATKNMSSKLYLIDNSPTDDLKDLGIESNIIYVHNPGNPGFGSAHNLAIQMAIDSNSKYHFIINPDIQFNDGVVLEMVRYMELDPNIGMLMPKILNSDGSIQFLPKLLPSMFWIFRRKLKKFDLGSKKFIDNYELRRVPESTIYNSPILSGCFTLLNLNAIEQVGAYDDKFFMYFEDFDLSRRMHAKYKTIYYPKVAVYHGYEGGANRSIKLFVIFLKSMITYFGKWGWVFDFERKEINNKTLAQFR